MYFPLLEKLNQSAQFSDDDIRQIDSLLTLVRSKGYYKRFHPRVYKHLGFYVNEKTWIEILDKLSLSGFLQKSLELCCPNCHQTIDVYQKYNDIPMDCEINCPSCGCDFEITDTDLFITYKFVEDSELFLIGAQSDDIFFHNGQIISQQEKDLPIEKMSFSELISFHPESVVNDFVNQKRVELKESLKKVIDASDKATKGSSLEEFTLMLFSCEPYLKFYKKNFENVTGELDVIFKVKKITSTLFAEFSDLLLVECKNWNTPVGAKEVRTFATKMEEFETNVGLIVAKMGISGDNDFIRDAKGFIRNRWQKNKQIIIVFTLEDLQSIVDGTHNLYEMLENKYFSVKMMSDN